VPGGALDPGGGGGGGELLKTVGKIKYPTPTSDIYFHIL
jgi:hypothetical protein